ncbi:MAG: DNA-binding protein [Syntrophobacterales bacterium]|nr:DNA-binding protein [Syntrophobacterales bacterium]
MKAKGWLAALMIVTALVLTASLALAGPGKWGGRGSGGWGMGTPYQGMYDPAKVETIAGEVIALEQTVPMKRMNQGIALVVKTEKETVSVHLGPTWYLERLDEKIVKGDKVEVKGARVDFFGKPAIIAAEVKKGDKTLVLRDAAGVPVWSGWGWKR